MKRLPQLNEYIGVLMLCAGLAWLVHPGLGLVVLGLYVINEANQGS